MGAGLAKLLIGLQGANSEAEQRKLSVLTGVPTMGLDGDWMGGSAAYGTEAALTMLAATGPRAYRTVPAVTS